MQAIDGVLASFALVALSEMGDKTQLLAFSLASRYRKPWAVLAGVGASTVVLNLLATTLGVWVADQIPKRALGTIMAVVFVGFGFWTLRAESEATGDSEPKSDRGAFLTTALLFFVAELGDKTQLAAIGLAAQYRSVVAVTLGATLGMLFADGLAIGLGNTLSDRIPHPWVKRGAAALFFLFGALAALEAIGAR